MAAPFAAGSALLVRQAADRMGLNLTPRQILNVLQTSGVDLFDGDDEDDNVVNSQRSYSRIDLASALAQIASDPPPQLDDSAAQGGGGSQVFDGQILVSAQLAGVSTDNTGPLSPADFASFAETDSDDTWDLDRQLNLRELVTDLAKYRGAQKAGDDSQAFDLVFDSEEELDTLLEAAGEHAELRSLVDFTVRDRV
jgi:hypothetical protein